ncbi:hypothetical protein GCM10010095_47380 [Streptomyces anthocyanicus]|uniref:Uncharacterized protein n=1 Tax=Streptomyces violaceolatus TaxID=67378 RepID=A0ABN3T3L0_9ACTN|nr:hypothetical protein GCM10010095_47380 [Streptomyces anthocyanicus]GHC20362.1 hypothetical protein GCM10010348_51350 [Streptomyces anthocyanicus]
MCRAPDACPRAPGTTAGESTLAVQRVRPDPGPASADRGSPWGSPLAPPAVLSLA